MRTIWKYTLDKPVNIYDIPAGARFVAAGYQAGLPVVWALVETTDARVPHVLAAVNSGAEAPPPQDYVGTITAGESGIVWHVHAGKAPSGVTS